MNKNKFFKISTLLILPLIVVIAILSNQSSLFKGAISPQNQEMCDYLNSGTTFRIGLADEPRGSVMDSIVWALSTLSENANTNTSLPSFITGPSSSDTLLNLLDFQFLSLNAAFGSTDTVLLYSDSVLDFEDTSELNISAIYNTLASFTNGLQEDCEMDQTEFNQDSFGLNFNISNTSASEDGNLRLLAANFEGIFSNDILSVSFYQKFEDEDAVLIDSIITPGPWEMNWLVGSLPVGSYELYAVARYSGLEWTSDSLSFSILEVEDTYILNDSEICTYARENAANIQTRLNTINSQIVAANSTATYNSNVTEYSVYIDQINSLADGAISTLSTTVSSNFDPRTVGSYQASLYTSISELNALLQEEGCITTNFTRNNPFTDQVDFEVPDQINQAEFENENQPASFSRNTLKFSETGANMVLTNNTDTFISTVKFVIFGNDGIVASKIQSFDDESYLSGPLNVVWDGTKCFNYDEFGNPLSEDPYFDCETGTYNLLVTLNAEHNFFDQIEVINDAGTVTDDPPVVSITSPTADTYTNDDLTEIGGTKSIPLEVSVSDVSATCRYSLRDSDFTFEDGLTSSINDMTGGGGTFSSIITSLQSGEVVLNGSQTVYVKCKSGRTDLVGEAEINFNLNVVSEVEPTCIEEGLSLGPVSPTNDSVCCTGLTAIEDAFGIVGSRGTCELPTGDKDGDTILNNLDNCPADANTDQADADDDGLGDVCDPTPNPVVSLAPTCNLNVDNASYEPNEEAQIVYSFSIADGTEDGKFNIELLDSDDDDIEDLIERDERETDSTGVQELDWTVPNNLDAGEYTLRLTGEAKDETDSSVEYTCEDTVEINIEEPDSIISVDILDSSLDLGDEDDEVEVLVSLSEDVEKIVVNLYRYEDGEVLLPAVKTLLHQCADADDDDCEVDPDDGEFLIVWDGSKGSGFVDPGSYIVSATAWLDRTDNDTRERALDGYLRIFGSDISEDCRFTDVSPADPNIDAIVWACENGIFRGSNNRLFLDEKLKRIEALATSNRMALCVGPSSYNPGLDGPIFSDMIPFQGRSSSLWMFEELKKGLVDCVTTTPTIQGYGDGTFRPINNVQFMEYAKISLISLQNGRILAQPIFPNYNKDPWYEDIRLYLLDRGLPTLPADAQITRRDAINFLWNLKQAGLIPEDFERPTSTTRGSAGSGEDILGL